MIRLCLNVLILVTLALSEEPKEDCNTNAREERCASIFEDKLNCHKAEYRPMLMDCLVTCGSCESFSCSNPQPDSELNCTALASQCNSSTWGVFMKDKCPATCGKCDLKNANLCNDAGDSPVCSAMAKFCNSVEYYDTMTKECPSTCNRCPSNGTSPETPETGETCHDLGDNCHTMKNRCEDVKYKSLMKRVCPKTCDKCSPSGKVCVDESASCEKWKKRGFCLHYEASAKMKHCAKTCNICQ